MDGEKKRRRQVDCLLADTEDGARVDIARDFTWLHSEMTARRRLFCYYVAMNELDAKRSLAECARRAGYKSETANEAAQKQLNRLDVTDEIANLKAQLSKRLAKVSLDDAIYRIVQSKVRRATMCVLDLYDAEGLPKPPSELTSEQREAVVAVEYPRGMMNYRVDKVAAENELVALWQRMQEAQDATGGYDVEATMKGMDGTAATLKVSRIPFEYQHATNPSYEE